jgi:hypothetical protein
MTMELWRWKIPREFFDVKSPVKPRLRVSSSGRVVIATSPGSGEWGVFYLEDGKPLWKRGYERVFQLCLSDEGRVALLNERGFGILDPSGEGRALGAGGSDMVCSSDLSVIYVYDSSDGTLVAATPQERIVRDTRPLGGTETLLGTSRDGKVLVGLSSLDWGVVLTFFDLVWGIDFSKVFRMPPGGRVERIHRPKVAGDGTVVFAITYSMGERVRNGLVLFRERGTELYLEAPGDSPFSYALSDDGEFLFIAKQGEGAYGYRRTRPLWSFPGDCSRVELGDERVLLECAGEKDDKFKVPHVLDFSGKPVWVGKERAVVSAISRDGKLVAYVDPLGTVKVVEIS